MLPFLIALLSLLSEVPKLFDAGKQVYEAVTGKPSIGGVMVITNAPRTLRRRRGAARRDRN